MHTKPTPRRMSLNNIPTEIHCQFSMFRFHDKA